MVKLIISFEFDSKGFQCKTSGPLFLFSIPGCLFPFACRSNLGQIQNFFAGWPSHWIVGRNDLSSFVSLHWNQSLLFVIVWHIRMLQNTMRTGVFWAISCSIFCLTSNGTISTFPQCGSFSWSPSKYLFSLNFHQWIFSCKSEKKSFWGSRCLT